MSKVDRGPREARCVQIDSGKVIVKRRCGVSMGAWWFENTVEERALLMGGRIGSRIVWQVEIRGGIMLIADFIDG